MGQVLARAVPICIAGASPTVILSRKDRRACSLSELSADCAQSDPEEAAM